MHSMIVRRGTSRPVYTHPSKHHGEPIPHRQVGQPGRPACLLCRTRHRSTLSKCCECLAAACCTCVCVCVCVFTSVRAQYCCCSTWLPHKSQGHRTLHADVCLFAELRFPRRAGLHLWHRRPWRGVCLPGIRERHANMTAVPQTSFLLSMFVPCKTECHLCWQLCKLVGQG